MVLDRLLSPLLLLLLLWLCRRLAPLLRPRAWLLRPGPRLLLWPGGALLREEGCRTAAAAAPRLPLLLLSWPLQRVTLECTVAAPWRACALLVGIHSVVRKSRGQPAARDTVVTRLFDKTIRI